MALAENDTDNQEDQNDEQIEDQPSGEMLDGDDQDAGQHEDEVVITIGGEAPPQEDEEVREAPAWVKELRKSDRENKRLLRERDDEIAKLKGKTAPEVIVVGDKPTLESCGFDEDDFDCKYESWQQRKQAVEAKKRESESAAKSELDAWNARLAAHGTAKAALKVKDYEEAEASAMDILNLTQQGIIVSGSENSAIVIYALGKNPAKAKELASIKDPVKFAFAVAKLEEKMKVTPRKAPPPPEKTVRGSAPVSGSTDSKLARLEAEADKTGDRTKVAAYRRDLRRNQ